MNPYLLSLEVCAKIASNFAIIAPLGIAFFIIFKLIERIK